MHWKQCHCLSLHVWFCHSLSWFTESGCCRAFCDTGGPTSFHIRLIQRQTRWIQQFLMFRPYMFSSFITLFWHNVLASQVVAIVINEKLTVLEQLFKKKNSQDLITVTGKWKVKTHWNILSCQWWKNKRGYCSDASWFVWLISGFLFLLHISNWWSICTKERSLTFEHVGKLSWSKSSYFMPNYMYQDAIHFQLGIAKQTCLYYHPQQFMETSTISF